MTDRIKRRGLAGFLIASSLGAILASATIVPPERMAMVLRQKVDSAVAEACKEPPKSVTKAPEVSRVTPEAKRTETQHPRTDPVKHLLRGILL
jgi:hypothetical protein